MFKETDKDFRTPIREFPKSKANETIDIFIETVIKDMDVDLSEKKATYIADRLTQAAYSSNISKKTLNDIHRVMISNYKWYLPFCYGSIATAYRKTKTPLKAYDNSY